MCQFLRSPKVDPDRIGLEIGAVSGTLSAMLTPPIGAPRMTPFEEVPLLRAVKMAKLMGDRLRTDVAVVDPLGIWHDWLVEWACGPLAALTDDPPGSGHAGFPDRSTPMRLVPHAPIH